MEATSLPVVVPATPLPEVNAEDFSWSASIKQHRHLQTKQRLCPFPLSAHVQDIHRKSCLTLCANCWARTSLPVLYVCVRPVSACLSITRWERPANNRIRSPPQYLSQVSGGIIEITPCQTCAEGFIKLGVEAPSTRPGRGDLKAAQHPGLIWEWQSFSKRGDQTTCDMTLVHPNLGWNYWRGKRGANWRSQEYPPLPPSTVWQSGQSRNRGGIKAAFGF